MGDGLLSVASHTIGHREIVLTEQNTINTNGGNDNYAVGSIARGTEDVVLFSNSFTDRINAENYFGVYSNDMGISNSVILSEDSTETSSSSTRQLVVIAVRGSVTILDWLTELLKNEIITQVIFHLSSVFKNYISSFEFWKTVLLMQRFCRKTKHFC